MYSKRDYNADSPLNYNGSGWIILYSQRDYNADIIMGATGL
jgi:hypothetical protein